MYLIDLPKSIEYHEKKNNLTEVVIEPCFPGYGVTLGNALRRVLLSSLPGAAVTHVKIKGVQHEFEAIEFVKEDVVDIILNLKKLNLKLHSNEPVKLELSVKGEKVVTAGDIKKNAQVEISNPEMLIATLTDKKADLEMEITVSNGRGYMAVDAQSKEKGEIGSIAVDSIYSPMQNVGFTVEHVRVGQQTNYEKLIMSITTDGTISAKEAIETSSQILIEHLNFIREGKSDEPETEEVTEEVVEEPKKDSKKTKADKEE